jgi:tetratricopeptide (TPR) repeat protein
MQQAQLTIAEVTRRYNVEMKRLHKHAISLNRMYRMTRDYTQVPEDITRREVLARVFQVSPALLGVVSVQEVLLKPGARANVAVPTILKRATVDLEQQESLLKCLWHIHFTNTAQHALTENAPQELESFEQQTSGKTQYRTQELLYSHYRLESVNARTDRGRFADAVRYADQAIAVAERMEDEEFVSAAWYTRGYDNLEWATVWKVGEGGLLVPNREKIREAIADFAKALGRDKTITSHPRPQLAGKALLEQARAYAHIKDENPLYETYARANIEAATKLIGKDSIEDPYLRILLDGSVNGLNLGSYCLQKANAQNSAGRFDEALESIEELEDLSGREGIGGQVRNNGFSLLLRAQAALGKGDYFVAAQSASMALALFTDLDVRGADILQIQDIYVRLLKTGYKLDLIEQLGRELRTYFSLKKMPK